MTAAVADYTPSNLMPQKLKKGTDGLSLELSRTPDILAEVSQIRTKEQVIVGFAAETENLMENARQKLIAKNLDLIVANDVSAPDSGFTADTIAATLLRRDGTLKEYRIALTHLSSTFGAGTPFHDLTRNAVGILQDALLKSGDRPVTVNKICRHIRAAYNRLVDDDLIERNPFRRFKALIEHHPEHRHLTLDDIARFLAAAEASGNEPGFRIARMYLYTGLRRRELLELRRDAIDLDRRRIRVPNIKHHSHRERWIILPPPALDDLRWFLARSNSDRPLHICQADTLTHWIKGYLRAAGLPESLHLHSLRHTFVTHALLSGESAWKIKDHLDHSSITVTEGYAHTEPEAVNIRY